MIRSHKTNRLSPLEVFYYHQPKNTCLTLYPGSFFWFSDVSLLIYSAFIQLFIARWEEVLTDSVISWLKRFQRFIILMLTEKLNDYQKPNRFSSYFLRAGTYRPFIEFYVSMMQGIAYSKYCGAFQF